MIQWRIYYADGSTFDSSQGSPWDAPATRVLVIPHRDPQASGGVSRASDGDYYLWKLDKWFAVTYDALMFYWFIEKYPHRKACLAGETVDTETWVATVKRASTDKDFYE